MKVQLFVENNKAVLQFFFSLQGLKMFSSRQYVDYKTSRWVDATTVNEQKAPSVHQ